MNINILKGGSSVFTRDISIGGNQYTEAIQRDLGLSFEEAERMKTGRAGDHDADVAHTPLLTSVIDDVNAEVAVRSRSRAIISGPRTQIVSSADWGCAAVARKWLASSTIFAIGWL